MMLISLKADVYVEGCRAAAVVKNWERRKEIDARALKFFHDGFQWFPGYTTVLVERRNILTSSLQIQRRPQI
jgi:hypothetical protein